MSGALTLGATYHARTQCRIPIGIPRRHPLRGLLVTLNPARANSPLATRPSLERGSLLRRHNFRGRRRLCFFLEARTAQYRPALRRFEGNGCLRSAL
jgi:hypothetical protein